MRRSSFRSNIPLLIFSFLSSFIVTILLNGHYDLFSRAQNNLHQELVCPPPLADKNALQMVHCTAPIPNNPNGQKKTQSNKKTGNSSESNKDGVSGSCGPVLKWGQKINDALVCSSHGCDHLPIEIKSSCDKSSKNSSSGGADQYWCTYLVFDSYKISGLKVARNPAVLNMHAWWKTAKGFKYVDGNTVKEIQPGYAIFLEDPGSGQKQHTFLVKEIKVDSHGNGTLISIEANTSKKSKTYPVSGWKVKNTTHAVQGFGGK